jgi:hypothetical protein
VNSANFSVWDESLADSNVDVGNSTIVLEADFISDLANYFSQLTLNLNNIDSLFDLSNLTPQLRSRGLCTAKYCNLGPGPVFGLQQFGLQLLAGIPILIILLRRRGWFGSTKSLQSRRLNSSYRLFTESASQGWFACRHSSNRILFGQQHGSEISKVKKSCRSWRKYSVRPAF